MTPVTTIYDISNEVDTVNTWRSLHDVYVREKITPQKSSIKNLNVKLKNENPDLDIAVQFEIRDMDNELIGTVSQTVNRSSIEAKYQLGFELHHLAQTDYYLIAKRPDIVLDAGVLGVSIKYDSNGSYNQSMEESEDGVEYHASSLSSAYDLWFSTEYAEDGTFDVTNSEAIIFGEKTHPVDTHVTIPSANEYGDRIDIVILNREGEYEVLVGDASTKPEAPEDLVENGTLKIAYVTVYQGKSKADSMILDQGDMIHPNPNKIRLRSVLVRLNYVEDRQDYDMDKNAPERIIYNLASGFLDSTTGVIGASSNIVWDGDLGAYRLSNDTTRTKKWLFKSDSGFSSTNIDHDDHENGIIQLNTSAITDCGAFSEHGTKREVGESKLKVWKDSSRVSVYPGGIFHIDETETLKKIVIQKTFFRDVKGATLYVFKGGKTYNTYVEKKYLEEKDLVEQYVKVPEIPGAVVERSASGIIFSFEGTSKLTKGNYLWMLKVQPKYSDRPAYVWTNPWYSKSNPQFNNTYVEMYGHYPVCAHSNGHAAVKLYKRPGRGINFTVITSKGARVNSGTITSDPWLPGGNIVSCKADLNITLPKGTSYLLEVSNNGGNTWTKMNSNGLLKFNSYSNSFRWKMTLYTNDISRTPKIYYDEKDGYAIKFTLNLDGGSVNDGDLVTIPFSGDDIVAKNVRVTGKFSHWKFLRWWLNKNAGNITVDVESSATDGATKVYNVNKTGMDPDDLDPDIVIWGVTEENDEYNVPCEVDEELFADTMLMDTCDVAWTPDNADVSVYLDSTYKTEGSYCNKFTFAKAVTGLIAHSVVNLDLTHYEQIQVTLRDGGNPTAGQIKLRLASDTLCTETIEEISVPAFTANNTITFLLNMADPTKLANVQSIGIIGTAVTADLYIDNLIAVKTDLVTLDRCESGWVADNGTTVTYPSSVAPYSSSTDSTTSMQVAVGATTSGLIAHKLTSSNLSQFKQFRLWMQSSVQLSPDDITLLIARDTACTDIIESHRLGLVSTAGQWISVHFELDDPMNLTEIKSIGLKLASAKGQAFNFIMDSVDGIKTKDMPFYNKYIRYRFHLTRDDVKKVSPVIEKVGVVAQLL
jgi:hypothetical protein